MIFRGDFEAADRAGILMRSVRLSLIGAIAAIAAFACASAFAVDVNLLPKFGGEPRTDEQEAADQAFVRENDKAYKGDLKKASADKTERGWASLRAGNADAAMLSFNQAWLLDRANGRAVWGMATAQAIAGKPTAALPLFSSAEPLMNGDTDFSIDYARTLGIAGAQSGKIAYFVAAFRRFEQIFEKEPQHVLNLQNWAITLFYTGNYAEAWKKIKLAEAAPRHADLDANFIKALQARMPRP